MRRWSGQVLERLLAEKLLDDRRYVENFVRYHAARGQGPLRVRAELRQIGLSGALVEDALDASRTGLTLRAPARLRNSGHAARRAAAERARQARFLGYRGFTSAQIRAALGLDIDVGADDEGL